MRYLLIITLSLSLHGWEISHSKDAFEKTETTILSQKSEKPIPNIIGLPVYPEMVVRVTNGEMEIFLDVKRYMGGVTYTIHNYKARTENGDIGRIKEFNWSKIKKLFFSMNCFLLNGLTYSSTTKN
ncbi:MAG: hypothetical protein JXK05_14620 [Campylobacterales bacterium]|nr:hypothetical protein [Campylobacterales bacterium]